MFTGIVNALGSVLTINYKENFLNYSVQCPEGFLREIQIGASISVDGICQTVVDFNENTVWFDAIEETLAITNLKSIHPGTQVHLERAAKFSDEIGGHLLSGHILGTAKLIEIQKTSDYTRIFTFECHPNLIKFMFPKGYIAIDGASLTLVEVLKDKFTVHLIPQTLEKTHFNHKKIGDLVNIEVDTNTQAIVLTVERWMARQDEKENV